MPNNSHKLNSRDRGLSRGGLSKTEENDELSQYNLNYLILTGDTYNIKNEIKKEFYPAKWDKLQQGWKIESKYQEQLKKFAQDNDLEIRKCLDFENNPEIKREAIKTIRERKAEKIEQRMECKKYNQPSARDKYGLVVDDWSFWTQPSNGSRRFTNYRDKVRESIGKDLEIFRQKQELQKQADNLRNFSTVKVKGDAERKRQAYIKYLDERVKVGDILEYFREKWKVLKINKKTYKIQRLRDNTISTNEKHLCHLVNRES